MKNGLIGIHQPNFFPWLGYFDKIIRSEYFVILDSVQFPKTGGTWMNRVRLDIGGKIDYFTLPVVRSYSGVRTVSEMAINENIDWRQKFLRSLQQAYRKTPYFKENYAFISELVDFRSDSVAEYNLNSIRKLCSWLEIRSNGIVLQSSLKTQAHSTDLLIAIIKELQGNAYLCGGGASGYQEDEKFQAAGIQLVYQQFQHPSYPQTNFREFSPGLSVLDCLLNCGKRETQRLLSVDA